MRLDEQARILLGVIKTELKRYGEVAISHRKGCISLTHAPWFPK